MRYHYFQRFFLMNTFSKVLKNALIFPVPLFDIHGRATIIHLILYELHGVGIGGNILCNTILKSFHTIIV